MFILAPSSTGKSHIARLICQYHQQITDSKNSKWGVVYCFHSLPPQPIPIKNIKYHKGLPSIDDILDYKELMNYQEIILGKHFIYVKPVKYL